MRTILFMVLAVAWAAPSPAESRLPSYALYTAVHGADFLSTEVALERGGTREGNPMPGFQSIEGRAAAKTLAIVGMAELDHILAKRKKTKALWGVRIGTLLVYGWVVQHNLRVR